MKPSDQLTDKTSASSLSPRDDTEGCSRNSSRTVNESFRSPSSGQKPPAYTDSDRIRKPYAKGELKVGKWGMKSGYDTQKMKMTEDFPFISKSSSDGEEWEVCLSLATKDRKNAASLNVISEDPMKVRARNDCQEKESSIGPKEGEGSRIGPEGAENTRVSSPTSEAITADFNQAEKSCVDLQETDKARVSPAGAGVGFEDIEGSCVYLKEPMIFVPLDNSVVDHVLTNPNLETTSPSHSPLEKMYANFKEFQSPLVPISERSSKDMKEYQTLKVDDRSKFMVHDHFLYTASEPAADTKKIVGNTKRFDGYLLHKSFTDDRLTKLMSPGKETAQHRRIHTTEPITTTAPRTDIGSWDSSLRQLKNDIRSTTPDFVKEESARIEMDVDAVSADEGLIVIEAGLQRPDTFNLGAALQLLLGQPCYSLHEVARQPSHIPLWHKAAQGGLSDAEWYRLFAGYRAAVDLPAAAFYRQLSTVFPRAKFVLLEPELHTRLRTSNRLSPDLSFNVNSNGCFEMMRAIERFANDGQAIDLREEAAAMRFYDRHVKAVKTFFSPERLLILRSDEGWGPLCRFLCLPEPDVPFPNENNSDASVTLKSLYAVGAIAFAAFLIIRLQRS